MPAIITACLLLTYTAFFATLNFTIYGWLNKAKKPGQGQFILLTALLILSVALLFSGFLKQDVMQLAKFNGLLFFSGGIAVFCYFGKYVKLKAQRVTPEEKQQTKSYSFFIRFQDIFWCKLPFVFISLLQVITIWTKQ